MPGCNSKIYLKSICKRLIQRELRSLGFNNITRKSNESNSVHVHHNLVEHADGIRKFDLFLALHNSFEQRINYNLFIIKDVKRLFSFYRFLRVYDYLFTFFPAVVKLVVVHLCSFSPLVMLSNY